MHGAVTFLLAGSGWNSASRRNIGARFGESIAIAAENGS
jgi:hypothetical protein